MTVKSPGGNTNSYLLDLAALGPLDPISVCASQITRKGGASVNSAGPPAATRLNARIPKIVHSCRPVLL